MVRDFVNCRSSKVVKDVCNVLADVVLAFARPHVHSQHSMPPVLASFLDMVFLESKVVRATKHETFLISF